ncbi:MAG: FAD-dependent oxidoreductase [Paraperlucidibaca sp.]
MQQHIAIIGSGMAGLAAAHYLARAGHRITIFEAQSGHGMDAHSLQWQGGLVDVPLRVMSPQVWGSVIDLAASVGVSTFPVQTFAACSWLDDQSTWFRSSRLLGMPSVGSWRHLGLNSARLAQGFWQLRHCLAKLQADDPRSLAELLADTPFDPLFWRGLVLPLLTTICTCDEQHLLAWPAHQLLSLLNTIVHGDTLVRLHGGTPALVAALGKGLTRISGSPVQSVREHAEGIEVRNARSEGGVFDRVVVATQANQLGFLDSPWQREQALLKGIRFDHGELWVHTDTRFLPAKRSDWSALNYTISRDLSSAMFSVWVNAVEPSLSNAAPILQTWNPLFEPEDEHVIARVPLARAVVHSGTKSVHEQLRKLHAEPDRRVFFCGSWAHAGVPLLESAVRSAQAVAALIPALTR